jgi:hypothetical protein
VARKEIVAHLEELPGSPVEQIADALQARAGSVATQRHRGRNTHYQLREGGWYLRSAAA